MRLTILALILISCSVSRAASIVANLLDNPGTPSNAQLRIRAFSNNSQVGTNVLVGSTTVVTPVNGLAQFNLVTGRYQVQIGVNPAQTIYVPDSDQTYQYNDLLENPFALNTFGQVRIDPHDSRGGYLTDELLAGTGTTFTLSTNAGNKKLTISSDITAIGNQNPNVVFAGPTAGGAAAPAFRSIVVADVPNLTADQLASKLGAEVTGLGNFPRADSPTLTAPEMSSPTFSGNAIADTITYSGAQAVPYSLGTVGAAGTVDLVAGHSIFTITATGSTWTLNVPADFPTGDYLVRITCTWDGDDQTVSFTEAGAPAGGIRPEYSPNVPINGFVISGSSNSKVELLLTITTGNIDLFHVVGDLFSPAVNASSIISQATSGISAVNVQGALAELDTEKLAIASAATVATTGSFGDLLNKPSIVSQAEAEAGVSTTERAWTAQRVAQAVAQQAIGFSTVTAYAAGTAYAITNVSSAVDFGTTDPAITINQSGTWRINAEANVRYVGATFGTVQTVTLKLRRTNNSAADLASSSRTRDLEVVTTFTGPAGQIVLPPIYYSTLNANDAIALYAIQSGNPSAGSVQIDQASLVAERKSAAESDVTAPSILSATIDTTGTNLVMVFNEVVTYGAGGNGGIVITPSGGASSATYSTGAGTEALTYTLARIIQVGETVTLAYTQPGNGIEDVAGNDKTTFSGTSVTNNSTQNSETLLATLGGDTINLQWGDSTVRKYIAANWTPGANRHITRVEWKLFKVGSPTGTISSRVYATSGGLPTTLLETSATTYDATTLTGTGTLKSFALTSDLTSGSTYAFDIDITVIGDASNNVRARAIASGNYERSTDGTTWINVINSTPYVLIYGY